VPPPPKHWRRWLGSGTAPEILARIFPADPLGLRARISRRARIEARLCDTDQVMVRAMARVARAAGRYRGRPRLDRWLDQQVQEALAEHLAEEAAGKFVESAGSSLSQLARPLGLDAASLQRGAARFHGLLLEDRMAFVELVLEQRGLDELAHEGGVSASEIARRARRGLEAWITQARQVEIVASPSEAAGASIPDVTKERSETST
jgi:hypothetical protein